MGIGLGIMESSVRSIGLLSCSVCDSGFLVCDGCVDGVVLFLAVLLLLD